MNSSHSLVHFCRRKAPRRVFRHSLKMNPLVYYCYECWVRSSRPANATSENLPHADSSIAMQMLVHSQIKITVFVCLQARTEPTARCAQHNLCIRLIMHLKCILINHGLIEYARDSQVIVLINCSVVFTFILYYKHVLLN